MAIRFDSVFYVYSPKSPLEHPALKGVDFEIKEGSFTALVGRTGCGKSTIVQHINALLNPTSGQVTVEDFVNVSEKKKRSKNLKDLRKKVGLVFQFPEYQLFEETVEKDVAFGPKNFGAKPEEALEAAHKALEEVGLGPEFYSRSPFECSGGEKRRAAIAGVLALRPKYLVVDEPTAGLDPLGAKEMMSLFKKVHEEGTSVVLVTHDMSLVLDYCDSVIVIDNGKVAKQTTPQDLFQEDIERYSLDSPHLFSLARACNEHGANIDLLSLHSPEDLAKAIARWKQGGR